MYGEFRALKTTRDGAILTVAISNPQSRNAINATLHAELPRLFTTVSRDQDTRVVVLTGDPAGGAFCAGGDFKWFEETARDSVSFNRIMQDGRDIVRNLLDIPQPVIAMINGAAIGLGATIALHCDLSYIDEAAVIADPHVGVGVVAGDGGAVIWPLLIGPNRAKEFLMTGDPIRGRDAAGMGLVNHAVPAEELREVTYAMAHRLATGPRLAVEWTKRAVNLSIQRLATGVLTASMALEGLTFRTADHDEAVRAFHAKEKPRFGRAP